MKKLSIIGCLVLFSYIVNAQTLFSYGKYKVDKDEFLKAFYKNNTGDKSETALKDYLNLYIAFKLKVQAAKDMHLDTMPNQKNDLLNFRRQVEEEYVADDSVVKALAKEAFNRSLKDVRISHIFIPFDENFVHNKNSSFGNAAEPQDTGRAFQQAMQAYNALKKGEDFGAVAEKFSADPSVKSNKGDIGYINVFTLSYPLEALAYQLAPGSFSAPYKSSIGYHIIKNTGVRNAFGKMRAAQILLAFTAQPTAAEKQQQKLLADSLYQLLQKGSDFETIARKFSSERNAHVTGGLMPDFGPGRYDPVFENAVLGLQHDGDITTPFETLYGIHIVKRIQHLPVNADTAQAVTLFKTDVLQDNRMNIAREEFAAHIVQQTGYKKIFQEDALLWSATDSFIAHNSFTPTKKLTAQSVLFSFDKEQKKMIDWLEYIKTIKNNYRAGTVIPYAEIMKKYVSTSAAEYYNQHLELYNTRFRNQLAEFADGNLLFDIMEKQVWNKAAEDKKALQQYYAGNTSKYIWGPSANAIFFTTTDKATAQEIRADIQTYISKWRTLAESSAGKIVADSARFELTQIPGNPENIKPGKLTESITDTTDGSTNFVYIINTYKEPAQKNFEEAKGMVINDYQGVLEQQWVANLKKKYPVKINESVFKSLNK
ncbi:MAG: peptidylprolyl isomerase [Agriterribacter sp.]